MNTIQALGFKSYQEYLESELWEEKRDFLINSINCCQKCGYLKGKNIRKTGIGGYHKPRKCNYDGISALFYYVKDIDEMVYSFFIRLEVHHLNYGSLGNENKEDLMVLCSYCHRKTHLEDKE